MLKICATIIISAAFVAARQLSFRDIIPSGDTIPDPCRRGAVVSWETADKTKTDPFQRDFQAAGNKWTWTLCQKDSDGDGRTNGDELGDPDCVWQPGGIPARPTNLGHPGICEPITSPDCEEKNTFLTAHNCPIFAGDEPTKTTSTTPPSTRSPRLVPASRNLYMSQMMDPSSNPWQLMRNCVCYCFEVPEISPGNRPPVASNRPPVNSVDETDPSRRAYYLPPWYVSGVQGVQQQQQANARLRNTQMATHSNKLSPADQLRAGPPYYNQQRSTSVWTGGWQPNNNQRIKVRPVGGTRLLQPPGSTRRVLVPSPPLDQAPEFNNTEQYTVRRPCTCACPKS